MVLKLKRFSHLSCRSFGLSSLIWFEALSSYHYNRIRDDDVNKNTNCKDYDLICL